MAVYQLQLWKISSQSVAKKRKLLYVTLRNHTNKKVPHGAILILCPLTEAMKLGIFHGNSSPVLCWRSSPALTAPIGWYQRFFKSRDFSTCVVVDQSTALQFVDCHAHAHFVVLLTSLSLCSGFQRDLEMCCTFCVSFTDMNWFDCR